MSTKVFIENPSYIRNTFSEFPKNILVDLKKINGQNIFKAVIIGTLFLLFIYKYQITVVTLIGICITVFIIWISISYDLTKITNKEQKKEKELKVLNKLIEKKQNIFQNSPRSLLYRNPVLVKVFSSLYVFARFNKKGFKDSLLKANQLIRVYESAKIGTILPSHFIEIAEQLSRDCMNSMQGIIHSLPSTSVGDFRFNVSLRILQEALEKIINDIRLISRTHYNKTGPTIYNPPPDVNSGPWANPINDKNYNSHFSFYW